MTHTQMDNKTTKMSTGRELVGVVVGAHADKTIRVTVQEVKMHPKYKKQYWVKKGYAVHDEKNVAKEGDTVLFRECRPLSKSKRWRLIRIVNA